MTTSQFKVGDVVRYVWRKGDSSNYLQPCNGLVGVVIDSDYPNHPHVRMFDPEERVRFRAAGYWSMAAKYWELVDDPRA